MKKILILLSFFSLVASGQSLPNASVAAGIMSHDLSLYTDPMPVRSHISVVRLDSDYDVFKIVLEHKGVGLINLLAKGPKGFLTKTQSPMHGLMIASGFFTGEDSIHLIGNFPEKILIGYEYPYGLTDFQFDPGKILQFVRKTPGQIAVALNWLSRQPWMAPKGLSVMGVSLGGVFLPSSLHLSQTLGVELEKTIFVCTSVDINAILRTNLGEYLQPAILDIMVTMLAAPTKLMDPQLHLPYLKGPFLVIQTDKDTVIPEASKIAFLNRLSEPKIQVILPGPHVNSDQIELIQKIQRVVIESFTK